jgi:hypothetical protein
MAKRASAEAIGAELGLDAESLALLKKLAAKAGLSPGEWVRRQEARRDAGIEAADTLGDAAEGRGAARAKTERERSKYRRRDRRQGATTVQDPRVTLAADELDIFVRALRAARSRVHPTVAEALRKALPFLRTALEHQPADFSLALYFETQKAMKDKAVAATVLASLSRRYELPSGLGLVQINNLMRSSLRRGGGGVVTLRTATRQLCEQLKIPVNRRLR